MAGDEGQAKAVTGQAGARGAEAQSVAPERMTLPRGEIRAGGAQPLRRQRRRWPLVVGLITATLLSLVLVLWATSGRIAGYFLRQQLPEIERVLGRKVDFGQVALHGLTGVSVYDVVISDKEGGAAFLEVAEVRVALTASPLWGQDFKVASLTLREPRGFLRRNAAGESNYADLQESLEKWLKPKEKSDPKEKKASKWSAYFKPLPAIEVIGGTLSVEDGLAGDFALRGVRLQRFVVHEDEEKAFRFEGRLGIAYTAAGDEGEETLGVSGWYRNKNQGALDLELERGKGLPLVEALVGREVRAGRIHFELPTTLWVDDVVVAGEYGMQAPMLSAQRVRATLTQLPPRKVGGVYVKEAEIEGLYGELTVHADGSTSADSVLRAFGLRPTEVEALAKRWSQEAAKGARSGVGMAPPKVRPFNVRDYFFAQRLYLTGGELRLVDERPGGLGELVVSDLGLAFGYRGIRRTVDVELDLAINRGEGGVLRLTAIYGLRTQRIQGTLGLSGLQLEPLQRWMDQRRGTDAGDAPLPDGGGGLLLGWLQRALRLGHCALDAELEVALDFPRERYDFTGELAVKDLSIVDGGLSALPVDLSLAVDLALKVRGRERLLVLERAKVAMHGVRFETQARLAVVDRPAARAGQAAGEDLSFDLSFAMEPQPAQQVLDAIPFGIRGPLAGMEVSGELGYHLHAQGLMSQVADMSLETSVHSAGFAVHKWPAEVDVQALNEGMVLRVKDPLAVQAHQIVIPPSTHSSAGPSGFQARHDAAAISARHPDWVLFAELNPWLVQMVTTTEDGSFFGHRGFSVLQMKAALQRNVDRGDFVRGASTISMQLVKNVFLDRQKTLARKLQEIFLTWLMESVLHVPKQRIMEVYFNVIEFGQEIYGIEAAARHYFGKRSIDLTLREAAFLMAIIPRPRGGEAHRLRGDVTPRLAKLMDWTMREMYRRKCDVAALERQRKQYARRQQEMPFVPCCPSASRMEAMRLAPLAFYVPDLEDPPYRPDMYTSDGEPLRPRATLGCGFSGAGDLYYDEGSGEEEEALLPLFPP